jgi:hypothetical protein
VLSSGGTQVGFARVVEDLESKGVRRLFLATKDAHELYRQHGGFEALKQPERLMEKTAHTAGPSR